MSLPDDIRNLPDTLHGLWAASPAGRLFIIMAALGSVGSLAGAIVATTHFLAAYLVAFVFALCLVLGMLFFVMLHHAVDAGWSTVVRRPAEHMLAALPALAVLFVPLLCGASALYHWTHRSAGIEDELLHAKAPYLNMPFFAMRAVLYFTVWLMLARRLRGWSLRQDHTGEPALSLRCRRWSAPGLIAYGLTYTFASIDWLMTLDPHWYSTIFGVYVFAQGTVSALALLSVVVLVLRRGPLRDHVADDLVHDLGKLVFAFAVFWAYIAFSQWFLIWYANIPEETSWMLVRWQGPWKAVIAGAVLGLFVVPFVALMPAAAKRRPAALSAVSLVVLAAHYLGVAWLVMPTVLSDGLHWHLLWIDAAALALVVGVCGVMVTLSMMRHRPVPVNDPRLVEALAAAAHHQAG